MAEETKSLADLQNMVEEKAAQDTAAQAPAPESAPEPDSNAASAAVAADAEIATIMAEPQIDDQGRSYATGKRKNAIARV